jgi:hypothetical protein
MPVRLAALFRSTAQAAFALALALSLAACGSGNDGDEDSSVVASERWQLSLDNGARGQATVLLARRADTSVTSAGALVLVGDAGVLERYELVGGGAQRVDPSFQIDAPTQRTDPAPDLGRRLLEFRAQWSLADGIGTYTLRYSDGTQVLGGVDATRTDGSGVTN